MSPTDLYKTLTYISAYSILIPLTSCFIKLKTFNLTLKILFIYLIVCVVPDALRILSGSLYTNYYYLIQNSFTLLECALLSSMYYLEFSGKAARRLVAGSTILFVILSLVLLLSLNGQQLNSFMTSAEACLMMVLSLSFFYKVHREMNIPRLRDYSFMLVNSAILVYFSTALILFLSADFIDNCPRHIFLVLWGMHDIVNIIYNSLFAIGIWRQKK